MPLVLLNVAGGDSVDDLRTSEGDVAFVQGLRRVQMHGLLRRVRREQDRR